MMMMIMVDDIHDGDNDDGDSTSNIASDWTLYL